MIRLRQARLQRKASRKAITQSATTGLIALIRHYNRALLVLTLSSLALSILLLFIGTYVYFDASIVGDATLQARTPTYDAIMRAYGINETDFAVLFPAHFPGSSVNFKFINCKLSFFLSF